MQHASNVLAISKYDRSAQLDLRERRANSTPLAAITFLQLGESICTSPCCPLTCLTGMFFM
jgi:hypothetical protein